MWIKIYFSVNIFNLRRHHQPRKMSISKSYSSASSENDLSSRVSRQLKHSCLHVFLSSIFSVGEIETDVERFLTAAYAQQLKEKHTQIGESHDMRVTDAHDFNKNIFASQVSERNDARKPGGDCSGADHQLGRQHQGPLHQAAQAHDRLTRDIGDNRVLIIWIKQVELRSF